MPASIKSRLCPRILPICVKTKNLIRANASLPNILLNLLSSFIDELITVDPHLHRISSLESIYSIPTKVIHSAPFISKWIKEHIKNPILIGPDMESKQWVSEVARDAGAPYTVLVKSRLGDKNVKVSIPHIQKYLEKYTPVIVDDIISTALTMIKTIEHLKEEGAKPPVCIGIHAVFSGDAYSLIKAGRDGENHYLQHHSA